MKQIIINGPSKLSGSVYLQGSKNAAMKHVMIPLLTKGKFILKNIPKIGSCENLLKIAGLQGMKYHWIDDSTLEIDSENTVTASKIPSELFYYTSGAIFYVPILASRFGECIIEKTSER